MERYYTYGRINGMPARPAKEQITRLKSIPASRIAAVLDGEGVLDGAIRPLSPGMRIIGPACTVYGRQGDTLMLQRVGDAAEPGDVIIADAGGCDALSVIGERLSYYICIVRKCAGIIIDGAYRDTDGILDLDIPFFGRKADPKLFGAIGPGAINVPISCGGVIVRPGDLIIGDDSGIVAIPFAKIEETISRLEEKA
jgi:regulator of RNase E activity RraA